jgi:hypothetical protein
MRDKFLSAFVTLPLKTEGIPPGISDMTDMLSDSLICDMPPDI